MRNLSAVISEHVCNMGKAMAANFSILLIHIFMKSRKSCDDVSTLYRIVFLLSQIWCPSVVQGHVFYKGGWGG